MIKICTISSARCPWCQIQRIEQGFIELGHEITPYISEADLIYCNNPPFDQIIKDKIDNKIKGKIIFNILDIPIHLFPNFDINKLKNQLKFADVITSISKYTHDSLLKYCNLESDIIYQPIMLINTNIKNKLFNNKFMVNGRINDPNKRFNLIVESLNKLGYNELDLAVCGSEMPSFGVYYGILKEEYLNNLYNSVEYVFMMGKIEGIGLPVAEAMAANKIPIICNDLTTREELLPSNLFPEYLDIYPNPVNIIGFIEKLEKNNDYKNLLKERLYTHYKNNLEHNFTSKDVAEKIIKTYENLVQRRRI